MTTNVQILRDLLAGQSTADSIAGRLRQPARVIEAYCSDLEAASHVEPIAIGNALIAYRLTARGREIALTPSNQSPRAES